MIWPPLKEGAPSLFATLQKIQFTQENYKDLVDFYKEAQKIIQNEDDALRSVACKWLNVETIRDGNSIKNYQRWSNVGKIKQKLKIGGIFPRSGNKYVAPELLPGK